MHLLLPRWTSMVGCGFALPDPWDEAGATERSDVTASGAGDAARADPLSPIYAETEWIMFAVVVETGTGGSRITACSSIPPN